MENNCHIENLTAQLIKENSRDTSWIDNSVATTLIICVTLLIIILVIGYWIKSHYKQHKKDDDIKELEKRIAELENTKKDTACKKEESANETERKYFLNFCYEMVRSKDENNKDIKEDCWKFLTNSFVADNKIKDVPQETSEIKNKDEE